jgi:hypothetical protein
MLWAFDPSVLVNCDLQDVEKRNVMIVMYIDAICRLFLKFEFDRYSCHGTLGSSVFEM